MEAARKAYKTSWGLKVPGSERGKLLHKLAELVEKNADTFAAIEALDGGKHFFHAKGMDIQDAIGNLRYYAGWADKNYGQTIEVRVQCACGEGHGSVDQLTRANGRRLSRNSRIPATNPSVSSYVLSFFPSRDSILRRSPDGTFLPRV